VGHAEPFGYANISIVGAITVFSGTLFRVFCEAAPFDELETPILIAIPVGQIKVGSAGP
jgi:hypothetical protein